MLTARETRWRVALADLSRKKIQGQVDRIGDIVKEVLDRDSPAHTLYRVEHIAKPHRLFRVHLLFRDTGVCGGLAIDPMELALQYRPDERLRERVRKEVVEMAELLRLHVSGGRK